ncbi:MAG: hypothetical protein RBU30_15360 [Polyangia bacterium]|jgi:hypothetical protein|nr:hypothetical protein [Polyangia bacterium]
MSAMESGQMPQGHNQPDLSEDGVDLTLIRWMLTLTPAERVEYIESIARSIEEIRGLNSER